MTDLNVDKVQTLKELTDRELLEIIFTSQVKINSRIINLENYLKSKYSDITNSDFYKTYKEYINDLYGSQYPIRQELEEYLKSVNSK